MFSGKLIGFKIETQFSKFIHRLTVWFRGGLSRAVGGGSDFQTKSKFLSTFFKLNKIVLRAPPKH